MAKPNPKSRLRLMVEGTDDQWSIINLLTRHSIDWNADGQSLPYVEDCKGAPSLLGAIETAARSLDRLGVVLDADADPSARWQQVTGRFRNEGIEFPRAPEQAGSMVVLSSGKRFGIWLMPNNCLSGKLEDFLATLIPPGDGTWGHASMATDGARALGAPIAEADRLKGVLHTWLAWREQPGMPYGTAITTEVLRHDSQEALRFVAWFRQLFLEP